jgi:hypothetical protein
MPVDSWDDLGPLPPAEVGIEGLVYRALQDPPTEAGLLADPRDTALRCGLSLAEADRIADLRAPSLEEFVRLLRHRFYGAPLDWEPILRRPASRRPACGYVLPGGSRLRVRSHGSAGLSGSI